MFQFLQPILLSSLAALAVPVIVHLWKVRLGKTLKIGSISLMTTGARQSAKRLKLTELLLFFLRCLLVTVLALLLAQPVWERLLLTKKQKGWILLERENLTEGYNKNKVLIDSLLTAGYEFHYFNTQFEKDDFQRALQSQKENVSANPIPYWHLLSQLNEKIPSTLPVYLFTTNKLNRFVGNRPPISLNLNWQTYTTVDSFCSWPARAFITSSDSVRLIIGHSTPLRTFYTYRNLSLKGESSDYNIDLANGKLIVSPKDKDAIRTSNNQVEVDTSTIRMTIFYDNAANDVNYVRAVIKAIQSFSKQKFEVSFIKNLKAIPANQDWFFWLSERIIPSSIAAKNIFQYEKGKVENSPSIVSFNGIGTSNDDVISISKRINKNDTNNFVNVFWQDGFGNVVLSKEIKNKMSVFHFYSRFNPAWNGLPWSSHFPKLLFSLILDKNKHYTAPNDRRIIDEKQMKPIMADKENVDNVKLTKTTELADALWLLSFVTFVIERLLTFRTKKVGNNA